MGETNETSHPGKGLASHINGVTDPHPPTDQNYNRWQQRNGLRLMGKPGHDVQERRRSIPNLRPAQTSIQFETRESVTGEPMAEATRSVDLNRHPISKPNRHSDLKANEGRPKLGSPWRRSGQRRLGFPQMKETKL